MKTVISAEDGRLVDHFAVLLPFELAPGRYVVVRWKAPEGKWISFNFADGYSFESKVVFHYNPRFDNNAVVRSSKDGSWGPEERGDGMPCKVGVTHECKFVVRPDFYECFVDGVKHTEFKHRMATNIAKFFFVGGEGEVYNVAFGDEADDQAAAECQKDLTIPYSTPCEVFPGRKIYISGTPHADAKRFRVILKADDDYAFCFAARMNESTMVMNSCVGGNWKDRESVDGFPFKNGEFFNILMEVDTDKFKVSVNDKPFTEFKHRMPISNITTLLVDKDVDLCRVDLH